MRNRKKRRTQSQLSVEALWPSGARGGNTGPALCRTHVSVKMNGNVQVLLAWVVHHPCDGMDGKSQIQSAACVDPHEHTRKFQMLGLDVWKGAKTTQN